MENTDLLYRYGTKETNVLTDPTEYHMLDREPMMLKELANSGGKITRVGVFREYGLGRAFYDISYIYGELPNGKSVRIWDTPDLNDAKSISHGLVDWAAKEGIYAKGIGLLDKSTWSILG